MTGERAGLCDHSTRRCDRMLLNAESALEARQMPFKSFTRVDHVVKKYKLSFVRSPLAPPDSSSPPLDDYFRKELDFNLRKLPIGRSEVGAGDVLLFPILREIWKPYSDDLALFSQDSLTIRRRSDRLADKVVGRAKSPSTDRPSRIFHCSSLPRRNWMISSAPGAGVPPRCSPLRNSTNLPTSRFTVWRLMEASGSSECCLAAN